MFSLIFVALFVISILLAIFLKNDGVKSRFVCLAIIIPIIIAPVAIAIYGFNVGFAVESEKTVYWLEIIKNHENN